MRGKKIGLGVLAIILLLIGAFLWGIEPGQTTFTTPSATPTASVSPELSVEERPAPITEQAAPTVAVTAMPTATPESAGPFCTLTVRCDDILVHMEKLTPGKDILVPKDGLIFPEEKLSYAPGESVFDVLHRTLKERGIHMEFVSTPMYNSVYVEGIGNLYEFDCGDSSGWTYTINGESPMHGCSQHLVEQGDKIEFIYLCDIYKSLK